MNAIGIMKNPQPNRDRAVILNSSPARPALPTKLSKLSRAKLKLMMPQILFLVSCPKSNLGVYPLLAVAPVFSVPCLRFLYSSTIFP